MLIFEGRGFGEGGKGKCTFKERVSILGLSFSRDNVVSFVALSKSNVGVSCTIRDTSYESKLFQYHIILGWGLTKIYKPPLAEGYEMLFP